MNQTDLYFSDVFLSHQISLLRFTAGEQNKTLALLKQMQIELKAKLRNGLTDFSKARVNKVLKEATGIIDDYYKAMAPIKQSYGLSKIIEDLPFDTKTEIKGYTVEKWKPKGFRTEADIYGVEIERFGYRKRLVFPDSETLGSFLDGDISGLEFHPPTVIKKIPITKNAKYRGQDEDWLERITEQKIIDKPLYGYHFSRGGEIKAFRAKETSFYTTFTKEYMPKNAYRVTVPKGTKVTWYDNDEFRINLGGKGIVIEKVTPGWTPNVPIPKDKAFGYEGHTFRNDPLPIKGKELLKTSEGTDMLALAQNEAKFTANTFAGIGLDASLPSEAALKALVNGSLIEGAQSSAWWARQSEDLQFKFANQVRQGIVQNETLQQIIRRVAGSKRLGIPGIMDVSRRNASALVHTSIMQVANDARLATFKANDDIVKGMRQLSTLDGHTTTVCIAYSGAEWNLEGIPIGGNTLPFNSGCPRHWKCRSLIVPITLSYHELGIDVDKPKGTRASDLGQIPSDTTFDGFLKRHDAAYVDDLLGPGRAKLWRDGKITLNDLVSQTGRPLTLKQLAEK